MKEKHTRAYTFTLQLIINENNNYKKMDKIH